MTFISTQVEHVRFNIQMKDIWELRVRVYKQIIGEDLTHPDYFITVECTQNSCKYGPL